MPKKMKKDGERNFSEATTARGPSKKQRKEDERQEEIQKTLTALLEQATSHWAESVEPDMVEATEYYHGEPFGNEKKNRSQVVSTDVKDATRGQLPSLLRIFFGQDRTMEFVSDDPQYDHLAEEATEAVRFVIEEDNNGAMVLYNAFKDALVRRLGVIKWYWDEFTRLKVEYMTGMTEAELQLLMATEEVEDVRVTGQTQLTGSDGVPITLYDLEVEHRYPDGRAIFKAVPPEEIRFTPKSRSKDDAAVFGHSRMVPRDELLAMGIDEDLIDDNIGLTEAPGDDGGLGSARSVDDVDWDAAELNEDVDPSQEKALFTEAYSLVDGNDDGEAELRRFECIGPDYEITNGDGLGVIVSNIPFALLTPDPEPHTIIGLGNKDHVGDVQLVKSVVLRGMLDSLSQATDPVTEVVMGQVKIGDLIKPDASKIVRVRRPGMMREVRSSFLGEAALPVLGYFDEMLESRVGRKNGALGIDADAMQSSTKAAVAATLTASQQQAELLAFVFAHTGLRDLFMGLRDLLMEHQEWARTVKLPTGESLVVDPTSWKAGLRLRVNLGLGQGTPEDKIQRMVMVVEKMEMLLAQGAPVVTMVEYRDALATLLRMSGIKSPEKWIKPWTEEMEQQYQQQQAQNAQNAPQDPTMALVKVEEMKMQVEQQVQAQKLELEKMKALMADDRERDKMARDAALREMEIEAKYSVDLEDRMVRAKIEADRVSMDAEQKAQQAQQAAQAAQAAPPAGGPQ